MQPEAKHVIKAVHEMDVEGILERFGQLEELKNGTYQCIICMQTLTLENLGSLKRVGEKLVFSCDKIACCHQILVNSNSRRHKY